MGRASGPMLPKPPLPAARCTCRILATKACSLTASEAEGKLRSLTRVPSSVRLQLQFRAAQRFPDRRSRRIVGARFAMIFAVGGLTLAVSPPSWAKS